MKAIKSRIPEDATPEEVASHILLLAAEFIESVVVVPGESGLEYKARLLGGITEIVNRTQAR